MSCFALALVPVLGISFAAALGAHAAAGTAAEETIATEKIISAYNCGAFPNVAWWLNDSAKVVGMVNKRYKGDWDKYIASWNRYGGSLQRSLENGEARLIKSQNRTLKGPTLAVHVTMVKKRVVVLKCLRDAQNSNNSLESLETAAGGDDANNQPRARPVAGKCDPLPQADWWSKTPTAVKSAVAKRYNGDWDKYIKRWKTHHASMKRSSENGRARVVKSRGITLRGKTLESHVGKIEKRIEVLECMQANAEAGNTGDGSGEASLETASGAPTRAVISGDQMEIEVEAECSGGQASFKLTNVGDRWPRLGEINIHRIDTKGLLVKRRLRMRGSQQMTFRIPRNKQQGIAGVGIFVSPSWFPRKFEYDAVANCVGE
ncbi:MAG: hypothetical protein HN632_11265 [Rhodospirillaceae bacterium]|nr:hypothetical protein [Rhodospirillaceae bacterium]